MKINICITCGACCAFYKASFYWAEADDMIPDGVPCELTEKSDHYCLVMKGTNHANPRCIALVGDIGKSVFCSIYNRRSSTCKNFEPFWENALIGSRCDKARIAWGLKSLKI